MTRVVQARLDDETAKIVSDLKKKTGWNNSEVVREALRALKQRMVKQPKRRLPGAGEYSSGIPDLATNPKYMEDFGK